jgi:hypothetical protein
MIKLRYLLHLNEMSSTGAPIAPVNTGGTIGTRNTGKPGKIIEDKYPYLNKKSKKLLGKTK